VAVDGGTVLRANSSAAVLLVEGRAFLNMTRVSGQSFVWQPQERRYGSGAVWHSARGGSGRQVCGGRAPPASSGGPLVSRRFQCLITIRNKPSVVMVFAPRPTVTGVFLHGPKQFVLCNRFAEAGEQRPAGAMERQYFEGFSLGLLRLPIQSQRPEGSWNSFRPVTK
jgi:hypothetical protein